MLRAAGAGLSGGRGLDLLLPGDTGTGGDGLTSASWARPRLSSRRPRSNRQEPRSIENREKAGARRRRPWARRGGPLGPPGAAAAEPLVLWTRRRPRGSEVFLEKVQQRDFVVLAGLGAADAVSLVGVDLGAETAGLVAPRDPPRVAPHSAPGSPSAPLARAAPRGPATSHPGWTGRTGKGRRSGTTGLGSNPPLPPACCVPLGE